MMKSESKEKGTISISNVVPSVCLHCCFLHSDFKRNYIILEQLPNSVGKKIIFVRIVNTLYLSTYNTPVSNKKIIIIFLLTFVDIYNQINVVENCLNIIRQKQTKKKL